MSHPLKQLLVERITAGLKRKTITSCSKWAEAYRIMGQPYPGVWTFKYHPWGREMHDCDAEMMIGQKGAQLSFTEVALNKSYYNIDVHGNSVLYVLPTSTPDASNFSTSRFDPALELSPHLRNLFSDVKNIGHKRAGSANMFLRGSRSRNQLKSIPVSFAAIDEVDEMVQQNIPLIFERMSGQLTQQSFLLSTPTIEHFGINAYFQQSSQDHFFFICPHCSRLTRFIFPECLEITAEHYSDPKIRNSFLKCKECKHKLSHEDKPSYLAKTGRWVSEYTDRIMRGFHVNQMYSSTVKPYQIASSFLKGRESPADEQEFWNSKMGLPHEPEGARILDADIQNCLSQYRMKDSAPLHALITMGIDVGKWLHYEITQYGLSTWGTDVSLSAEGKLLKAGKVEHFEELDAKMKQFKVNFCVIDANPERRKALEFAQRNWGHVRLCFYGRGVNGKSITLHPQDQHTLTVDRTSWLDLSLGRIRNQRMKLPMDVPIEYKEHLKNLVRITEKDKDGNPTAKYIKTGDDHFAHARNYNEIALQLAASFAQSQNIGGVY